MCAYICTVLSNEAFTAANWQTVVLHEPEPITKGHLLDMSRGRPETAYRLYLACDERTTPQTVLCRDAFEMPDRRQFPELADDDTPCGDS